MTKAIITKVGSVDDDGTLRDWGFDCRGAFAAFGVGPDSDAGVCGYTIEELRTIALGGVDAVTKE